MPIVETRCKVKLWDRAFSIHYGICILGISGVLTSDAEQEHITEGDEPMLSRGITGMEPMLPKYARYVGPSIICTLDGDSKDCSIEDDVIGTFNEVAVIAHESEVYVVNHPVSRFTGRLLIEFDVILHEPADTGRVVQKLYTVDELLIRQRVDSIVS